MKRIKFLASVFLIVAMIVSCMPILPQSYAADTGLVNLTATNVNTDVSNLYDEDKVSFSAMIRNIGEIATSGVITVEFYIDGKLIQSVNRYDSIPSGGRANISTSLKKKVSFGSHKLSAMIKESSAYKESDYTDNIIKQRITVSTDANPNPVFDAEEGLIINQVYGGGGKGETPFTHSFIELYNTTDTEISLDGYKLTYSSKRSASNPGGTNGTETSFNLSGSVPAKTSFLVRCAAEQSTVSIYSINKYDAQWGRVIDNKQYCVRLQKNNAQADAVSATSDNTLTESIGETAHVVGISKQTVVRRKYFVDTNNNFEDFEVISCKEVNELSTYPRTLSDGEWTQVPVGQSDRPALNPSTENVAAYEGTIIEGESMTLLGSAKTGNTYTGYHGKGYAVVPPSTTNGLSFTINAPEASFYTLNLRAGNADLDYGVSYDLYIGNNYYTHTVDHQKSWSSWKISKLIHYLQQGENTIKIIPNANAEVEFTVDYVEYYKNNSEISTFSFTREDNPFLPENVEFEIDGSNIKAFVPADMNLTNIIPRFTTSNCDKVTIGDTEQKSGVTANNYDKGQYYRCYKNGQLVRTFAVIIQRVQNTNLPNLYINLPGVEFMDKYTLKHGSSTEKDKDVNFQATLKLNKESNILNGLGGYGEFTDQRGVIHIRGNSTAGQPKKGYKLKFDAKLKVLDMDISRHWVLVANYDDKTLMRQYVGYELASHLYGDSGYTPKMRYVNMYLDGEYMGVYLLGQNIRVSSERVDIEEITDKSTDITGGYIIEFDQRQDVDYHYRFSITYRQTYYPFSIVAPDEEYITQEHVDYIKGYMNEFFNSLSNPSSHAYEKYIDVDSFVNWYIAMEIMKTSDAQMYASIFLYKDANDKLHMGPCWDFNPGAGNINYNGSVVNTSGFWIRNGLWWRYLFQDLQFTNKVKARYQELRANYDIVELIDQLTTYLDIPQEDNFACWPCLSTYCWPEPKILYEYDAYVAYFRQWMQGRLEWLDKQYGA